MSRFIFSPGECYRATAMRTFIIFCLCASVSLCLIAQSPRRTVRTTDGQSLEGRVLNEGMSDLQILTDDQRVHLLRKTDGGQYRAVTSQKDWPTYHGDPAGNRYTTLTQIDKSNVARLAPRWVFPIPNVTQVENTPLVAGGIMYVSSANEVYALDAGSG